MKPTSYKSRIQKLQRQLKKLSSHAALIIGNAPLKTYSRDQHYAYRQDSDYFYLTGSTAPTNSCLILRADSAQPVVMGPAQSELSIVWEGKKPDIRQLAKATGAKARVEEISIKALTSLIQECDLLLYQNEPGSPGLKVAEHILKIPSHARGSLPTSFAHTDILLEPMRLFKSRDEIAQIETAVEITRQGFEAVAHSIKPGMKEYQVAALCEYHYKNHGGDIAFQTIAGTGASAATLHYTDLTQTLRKGEMLLLDSGASYQYYAADVTRCFPVSGAREGIQDELYDCVNEALEAALSKIRHGVKIKTVYDAAAKVLTEGLKDWKILKGSLSSLLAKEAYKPYFPHGIGHSLGIDVHDIGRLRGNNKATLQKDMVFTVEPGLYFRKKTGRMPACGVRLEDDILVTAKGYRNLTKSIPR